MCLFVAAVGGGGGDDDGVYGNWRRAYKSLSDIFNASSTLRIQYVSNSCSVASIELIYRLEMCGKVYYKYTLRFASACKTFHT